jgi:hypothetical protein
MIWLPRGTNLALEFLKTFDLAFSIFAPADRRRLTAAAAGKIRRALQPVTID